MDHDPIEDDSVFGESDDDCPKGGADAGKFPKPNMLDVGARCCEQSYFSSCFRQIQINYGCQLVYFNVGNSSVVFI